VHLSILANQETSPTPQCHSGQLEDTTHFGVMQLGIAGLHLAAAFGDHPSFPNLAKFACNKISCHCWLLGAKWKGNSAF